MCECENCGKAGYVFIDSSNMLCDNCYNDLHLKRSYSQADYEDDECQCKACNAEMF